MLTKIWMQRYFVLFFLTTLQSILVSGHLAESQWLCTVQNPIRPVRTYHHPVDCDRNRAAPTRPTRPVHVVTIPQIQSVAIATRLSVLTIWIIHLHSPQSLFPWWYPICPIIPSYQWPVRVTSPNSRRLWTWRRMLPHCSGDIELPLICILVAFASRRWTRL